MVAPHAGAWIETRYVPPSATALIVAPHAGAWIETYNIIYENSNIKVAPHAGAWIETKEEAESKRTLESRPTRARGLKHSKPLTNHP